MKPPTLLRYALLFCGAVVLSCEANAQNAFAPTTRADESCSPAAPSTIACVRKYMISDRQLSESVSYNSLSIYMERIFSQFTTSDPVAYAAAKKRVSGIQQYADSESAEMGLTTPVMYVSMIATQAAQTTEGKPFIVLNKDAFRLAVLTDAGAERMNISISRELAHIRNGDTSPSAIVRLRNDPAASREAGLRADLEGAGPVGAKDPIAVTAALQSDMRMELQQQLKFLKDTPLDDLNQNQLSDRDYKRISDEHTRVYNDSHTVAEWDRIVALRKENRLMAEYEQTHAVRTHSDREAESKWLVAQILPDALRGGQ